MKLLVVSGSTRQGSLNTRLARLVATLRPSDDVEVVSNLADLPFYDADAEAIGWPAAVAELREAAAGAEAVVIVTPEYNGTVPGVLSNALDWLSRPAGDSVLRDKVVQVHSASPGRNGGASAATQLRGVLARIGAVVLEGGLSVSSAHLSLSDGDADPATVAAMDDELEKLGFVLAGDGRA